MRRWKKRAPNARGIVLVAIVLAIVAAYYQSSVTPAKDARPASAPRQPSSTVETTRPTQPQNSADDREVIDGFVVHVKDGDSLVLRTGNQERTVRFWGIDSPEGNTRQPFAEQARDLARKLCDRKQARVVVHDTDRYQRVVGEVILKDGTHVNQEMVRAGLAWHYDHHAPNETILADLQREAQRSRRGLWNGDDPIPPWDWRREHPPNR